MTAALAAPLLTRAQVAALEADTRANLSAAIGNLARLREGGAHTVAGFDSWAGYVLARLGDLLAQLRLPREERLALVSSMDEAGMAQRDIADRLGVSLGTVNNDLGRLGRVSPLGPRGGPAPTGKRWEQAAEHLRRRGDQGITLVELAAVMGISEGSASGLLTYLGPSSEKHPQRKGLAVRLEDRRAGQRVHVLASDLAP